jgi:hypothetical protein
VSAFRHSIFCQGSESDISDRAKFTYSCGGPGLEKSKDGTMWLKAECFLDMSREEKSKKSKLKLSKCRCGGLL